MGDTGPGRLALRKRGAALPSLGKGFLYLPPQLKECPALIRCRRLPGLELASKKMPLSSRAARRLFADRAFRDRAGSWLLRARRPWASP